MNELKKAVGTYATEHAKRPYPNLEFFEIEDAFLAGSAWQQERADEAEEENARLTEHVAEVQKAREEWDSKDGPGSEGGRTSEGRDQNVGCESRQGHASTTVQVSKHELLVALKDACKRVCEHEPDFMSDDSPHARLIWRLAHSIGLTLSLGPIGIGANETVWRST